MSSSRQIYALLGGLIQTSGLPLHLLIETQSTSNVGSTHAIAILQLFLYSSTQAHKKFQGQPHRSYGSHQFPHYEIRGYFRRTTSHTRPRSRRRDEIHYRVSLVVSRSSAPYLTSCLLTITHISQCCDQQLFYGLLRLGHR